MYLIKYCGQWNYRPRAESLSAQINKTLPDTCEIEQGEIGQFSIFRNGELILSKATLGRFATFEDVQEEYDKSISTEDISDVPLP